MISLPTSLLVLHMYEPSHFIAQSYCLEVHLPRLHRASLRSIALQACGWAYGMNLFDLQQWRVKDITGIYHHWQELVSEDVLGFPSDCFPWLNGV